MDLSIIVPAYNEMNNIERTLDCLGELKSKMNDCKIEIIAVDDGSWDLTGHILKNRPDVKVITNKKNMGKGYSVKQGIISARGNFATIFDADMAYSTDCIEKAYRLTKSYDVIYGKRKKCGQYPLLRFYPSKMFHLLTKYYLNLEDIDTQCGFKMFRRNLFSDVQKVLTFDDFSYDMQIVYYFKQINVKYFNMDVIVESHSKSSVHLFKDGYRMISNIKKIKKQGDASLDIQTKKI